jgi:hypothetical protein
MKEKSIDETHPVVGDQGTSLLCVMGVRTGQSPLDRLGLHRAWWCRQHHRATCLSRRHRGVIAGAAATEAARLRPTTSSAAPWKSLRAPCVLLACQLAGRRIELDLLAFIVGGLHLRGPDLLVQSASLAGHGLT